MFNHHLKKQAAKNALLQRQPPFPKYSFLKLITQKCDAKQQLWLQPA